MRRLTLLTLSLILALPLSAWAFERGPLGINGFLSQGYMYSYGNNFLAQTTDGTFEINEMGVTLHSRLGGKLRLGLQLLSRDLGEEGNNDVRLDWAVADYRHRDWLGLRIGKIKLPIGLYNQGRDSDFLRPMAWLPQSVYDENKRNLLVAAAGIGLYGNIFFSDMGDVDYQVYAGEADFPDDSGQARRVQNLAQRTAKQKGLGLVTDMDADNKYVYGASLIYNTSLDGLRIGASYFNGSTDFDIQLTEFGTGKVTQEEATARNKDFVVFSLEYTTGLFTLASEYTEFTADREVLGSRVPSQRSQGWYGQASVRPLEKLTLSVLYDHFYANKADHGGKGFEEMGLPSFVGWRKDFGVALRYDINYNWLVKAEWHHVDGGALGLQIFNPDGLEKDWNYAVAKASFNF
ncbi:MAG: hypothetical protein C0617_15590 [Desulfuromonas sp.]|uniref:hypothetical protein n=1 Tax=Desulfuromonas sp. TaxID=892 RepID=UPI000CC0A053|nr:hypothetical protein [Desulfuromonas sp.]PLX81940.1 MAG: hypothetical protein C0617_15590 [Desulfuromonas sp.]